jgi:5'-phosphate synthase pdxT subunit
MVKHKVGVLALQGGFASHAAVLASLGCDVSEVRTESELASCEGLVLPGGESTVLTRLLMQPGTGPSFGKPWEPGPLFLSIKEFARAKPVMGTCAGLIMLAEDSGDERVVSLAALPVTVARNAYGRQTESFIEAIELELPRARTSSASRAANDEPFQATFIRAPKITQVGKDVAILARAKDRLGNPYPVMVQFGRILGLTFHPELNPGDARVHEYFLSLF